MFVYDDATDEQLIENAYREVMRDAKNLGQLRTRYKAHACTPNDERIIWTLRAFKATYGTTATTTLGVVEGMMAMNEPRPEEVTTFNGVPVVARDV